MEHLTVRLSVGEMAVAQKVAAMRQAMNTDANVPNRRIGPQSDQQTDLDGIVGELAFAKAMNVYPDLDISPRKGGSDVTVQGWRLDVKTTRHRGGRLVAVPGKAEKGGVDGFVLAVVNGPTVTFPGWALASELLNDQNLTNLGHGMTYALEQSRLRPIRERGCRTASNGTGRH